MVAPNSPLAGASIALTDRFFDPTFVLPLGADGRVPGGSVLEPERWYKLSLEWSADMCRGTVEGREAGGAKQAGERRQLSAAALDSRGGGPGGDAG